MRRLVVKPYLNANGELPAYVLDASTEQTVESAIEHGEQNSHLNLSPAVIRDVLRRIGQKTGNPETPVAVISSSGSRYFFRQIVEPTMRNVFFLSHNEIPIETKVLSLGVIQ
jgi:flagellar biosynthesis component FlhA